MSTLAPKIMPLQNLLQQLVTTSKSQHAPVRALLKIFRYLHFSNPILTLPYITGVHKFQVLFWQMSN